MVSANDQLHTRHDQPGSRGSRGARQLARNVGALISRLPQQRPRDEDLHRRRGEQVAQGATGDRNGHAWHLALSGLRRGEICGLEWSQIDWSAKTVTVSKNRVSVAGQAMESAPKTRRSTRTLPLTPGLHAALKAARSSPERRTARARRGVRRWHTCRVRRSGTCVPPRDDLGLLDQDHEGGGRPVDPTARRSAYLRNFDAPRGGAYRSDFRVARPCRREFHDAYLHALAGRRVEGCGGEFGGSCDKP